MQMCSRHRAEALLRMETGLLAALGRLPDFATLQRALDAAEAADDREGCPPCQGAVV